MLRIFIFPLLHSYYQYIMYPRQSYSIQTKSRENINCPIVLKRTVQRVQQGEKQLLGCFESRNNIDTFKKEHVDEDVNSFSL